MINLANGCNLCIYIYLSTNQLKLMHLLQKFAKRYILTVEMKMPSSKGML